MNFIITSGLTLLASTSILFFLKGSEERSCDDTMQELFLQDLKKNNKHD